MAVTPIQDPKHTDAAALLRQASAGAVLVMEPGVVISYNAATNRAEVQPSLQSIHLTTDNTDGYQRSAQASCVDVPVAWPSWGTGSLVGTLQPGDQVFLHIAGRSLDEYKASGTAGLTQQDLRRHSLQDAVAIPVIVTPLDAARVYPGATVLYSPDLRLGASTAVSPVALSVPVATNDALLVAVLTSIATAANFPAAQVAIATWLALSGFPQPTGATTVKAL
jgi:hypothetical protein